MRYVFPAVLEMAENGGYFVTFPDIGGCVTEGQSLSEALESAEDAMCFMLYAMEKNGLKVPKPSRMDQWQNTERRFVTMITCDTVEYRSYYGRKSVKKTVTIPDWLCSMAEKADINFSAVLTEAIKEKLEVN